MEKHENSFRRQAELFAEVGEAVTTISPLVKIPLVRGQKKGWTMASPSLRGCGVPTMPS